MPNEHKSPTGQWLTLYLDDSIESDLTRQVLEERGTHFSISYSTAGMPELPAVQTPLCSLYGYTNIRKYLLPDLPRQVMPRQTKAVNGTHHVSR